MNIVLLFIGLNVANVVLQTIKNLATVKCGKAVAAIVNAVAFGLYTIVLVYTNADFPLWVKVVVTAGANLIGVYVVKLIEEKIQKEKLWRVEVAVNEKDKENLLQEISKENYSYYYLKTQGYYQFTFFCNTKKDSKKVKNLLENYNIKYFVTESKTL